MSKPIRSSGFRCWLVPLSLGLLVASATVSVFSYWSIAQKVDQCDRLIAALNDGQTLVRNSKVQDASSSYQFAQSLERITLKLGLVHLEDSQLQEYQLQFSAMYREFSQAFRQISRVLQLANASDNTQEGLQQIERARNDVQSVQIDIIQTARDADRLIGQVNRYCAR
ncbi:MAG TPA: hypothetical protein IGS17_01700 [Oscillatoriales cyanobacterium M59_W2019_021]|nr:MAG: hypothetical protein D6728_06390 [Cyanobacteria bacterium J055]HIK31710.1 hypothetical protein [Oscillatoriales cyanobacterium M4454_W2019_049]HIK49629.1 hypothetical protein [Oscillatoriales cyanobacterium M59_W2019_021]